MNAKDRTLESILSRKVIAVLREESPDHVAPLIDALRRVGITTIEITLTTPGAVALIQEHSSREDVIIGAGSVLNFKQLEGILSAGARFYASPCLDLEVLTAARDADLVALPGALTPTEILTAWRNGADIVKLFPMPAEGPNYIRSILAPMPEVRLAPSGGVNGTNIADFLRAGASAVNVGSWLTPERENLESRLKEVERRGEILCSAIAEAGMENRPESEQAGA